MEKEVLRELGLTNNETEVYMSLLKEGSISVNGIAEKSGLHRQACYDALDRLLEKGFVSFVIKNSKKYYQGIHPEKILEFLRQKESRFRTVLPDLINLTRLPREDTSVEVYKGKNIVRIVYREIIKELEKRPGEVLQTGIEEKKFMEEDRIALTQHIKKIKRMKCKERILIKEGDTHFVEGSQTMYRWIPEESFTQTPTYVYGNKTSIIIWGNPNYAIVIENKDLAEAYRQQFNLLWKIAKKIKSK